MLFDSVLFLITGKIANIIPRLCHKKCFNTAPTNVYCHCGWHAVCEVYKVEGFGSFMSAPDSFLSPLTSLKEMNHSWSTTTRYDVCAS